MGGRRRRAQPPPRRRAPNRAQPRRPDADPASRCTRQGGKAVVPLPAGKVLVVKNGGGYCAVSNRCPHLGLPLVGKTALFQGEVKGGCITCPAHGTVFSLETGAVEGEWCPKLPNLPIIGKGPKEAPLPVFKSRVVDGMVEVDA